MEYGRLGKPEPSGGSASRSLTIESTHAPQKSKLKLLLIVAATLIAASAVSAAIVVVVIRNEVDSEGGERLHYHRPSQAMSRACSKTRYPNLCVNSLIDFPGATAASGKDLVHISVNMTLQKFGRALYFASEIGNLNMNPHVRFVRKLQLISVSLFSCDLAFINFWRN